VVSQPSRALFGEQEQAYRDLVLGWERWVGDRGTIIGMRPFGASGPGAAVREHFGFTAQAVAAAVRAALDRQPGRGALNRSCG
jgi:transketolase